MALAILKNRGKAAQFGRLFCVGAMAIALSACDAEDTSTDTSTENPAVSSAQTYEVGQVITRPSGLKIEVLIAGDGPMPTINDEVLVDYEGRLTNGEVFDSSYSRGKASRFPVGGLIEGWTEALQLMPTGSKWRLTIPSELAYGERELSGIPANSTLVFDMELIDIIKAPEFNEEVAAIIAEPFVAHDCGEAPSYDPATHSQAELQALHADGNAWQDCMSAYIKTIYEGFDSKANALRQISPNQVPNDQKQQVNDYFAGAAVLVGDAEKELEAFKGIPKQ
jgi:FKBP-type peptidyl-prolyl cis-trans isomerase 2